MAGELLKNLTGIDIVHVPYKGSTGMRTDILSGQIQILFDSIPTMAQMIKALSLIHISEPTRLRRISYAVFCLKKKKKQNQKKQTEDGQRLIERNNRKISD